jgi:hypothetical protein
MNKKHFLTILITLFLSSCSTTKIASDVMAKTIKKGLPAFMEEDDLRLAKTSLESNIKLLEVLHKANPENKNINIILSQAYFAYAFTFVDLDYLKENNYEKKQEKKKRAIKMYKRGLKYGLNALFLTCCNIEKAIKTNNLKLLKRQITKVTDEELIFWPTFNWAMLINLSMSSVETIADLPKLNILLDRMLEIDENYFYSSPLTLKATMMCATPKMFGGKAKQGIKLMKKAMKNSNENFLVTHLMYLEYCVPQVQDKAKFKELSKEIENKDIKEPKDLRLINKSVQNKLPYIKNKVNELFL